MLCPVCGYAMSAFDSDCPRCHGKATPQASRPAAPLPQSVPPPHVPTPPPQIIVEQRGGGFLSGLGSGAGAGIGCCCLFPLILAVLFAALMLAGAPHSDTVTLPATHQTP